MTYPLFHFGSTLHYLNPLISFLMFRVTKNFASILVVSIGIIITSARFTVFRSLVDRFHQSSMCDMSTASRTPVYFLSHGGPNIMYDKSHPVFPKLQEIGREITQKVKPKAVVVFSAHWQGEANVIGINDSEITDLIYDFYGFPAHYYKEKYPNVGSKEVSQKVIDELAKTGIKTQAMRRGLDHGVWSSFKVVFDPDTNPLNVPIVQVSLFGNEDPNQHFALGRAIKPLREQGILIIVSGMAVHNLQDRSFDRSLVRPYAKSFDEALREAAEASPDQREAKLAALLQRKDARPAHPTFEHLLPIYVGAGAAGEDQGKRLYTLVEMSFSWAQFRFGEVCS